jgi:DNA-directed RNA polymerase subunit RPC12/RpoP
LLKCSPVRVTALIGLLFSFLLPFAVRFRNGSGQMAVENFAKGRDMSRRLLAILLNELNIVRVKCRKCGKIVELKSSDLIEQFKEMKCPLCNHQYMSVTDSENPFRKLAKAIESFKAHAGNVEVEFVLEDKSGE